MTFVFSLSPQVRVWRFEIMAKAPITRALPLMRLFMALTLVGTSWTLADEPNPASWERELKPLLTSACAKCHEGKEPEAGFALAALSADMSDIANRHRWKKVAARVRSGEMPPKDEPSLSAEESSRLVARIEAQIRGAELAERQANGRSVLRRLNRVEYENTVCDLLSIKTDLKDLLATDGSSDGFDNIGSALHMSSFALERYLTAGEKALRIAIANSTQPPLFSKRMDLRKERHVLNSEEKVYRHTDDALVLFSSSPWNHVYVSDFYPPQGGTFRIRVSASAIQSDGKPLTYRLASGELRGKAGLIGYFDAPAGEPKVSEIVVQLEPRTVVTVLPYGLARSTEVHKVGPDQYEGPGVAVQWVEIEGPLYDAWPPPSHTDLMGDLKQQSFPHQQIHNYREVVSDEPERDAKSILLRFARKAFRRAVSEKDIDPYLQLVRAKLAEKWSFEESLRVGLLGVLMSDDFLYLRESTGPLDAFALASRMSYFLWSSCPDEELLTLAESGRLKESDVLRQQVERMLNSPKATAFTENFVGQWLGLRNIDFTEPNTYVYPEFDHMLKVSMIRETELFFEEVLKNDLPLTSFVDCDFSMLNERLAKHYGIADPQGYAFQKVALPKESHRGGVLTMASVLKVTANGSYTHPVHRGVWVLERILGNRPPNPPANVPVVEPDVRGTKGIRDQLAKHRDGSCASCHAMIDPPGFALESFDVIGGWREHYRSTGNGEPITIDGKRMNYLRGQKVECDGALPDGRAFANIDDFKKLLLDDKDQLARALTRQLVTYATGASPVDMDQDEIEKVVAAARDRGYGLRSLVHAIVQSPLFQSK